jgi:4-amino-4-deoxy-L-arabinose transferase-like glycosyltransferase
MPTTTSASSKHVIWTLAALVITAAILRLPGLEIVPPPLNEDEASRGYDAWAILETGADRHGQRWPLFLQSFGIGDYTAALTTYLTVPFIAMLGPTTLAMRLPDALLSVATVALLYVWLVKQANSVIALLAAGILAVDPWHIALTRTAHESGFTPFFFTVALLAFHRAGLMPSNAEASSIERRDRSGRLVSASWALLAGLMFGAHTWAYPATRLFTPLFGLATVMLYRRHYGMLLRTRVGRSVLRCLALGLGIGLLPVMIAAISHPEYLAARARAALLIYKGLSPAMVVWGFITNYAGNIGPRYMFQECDEMSGHIIPGVGLHLMVWAPFFAIGLVRIVAGWRKETWRRILLWWFLLYPIPAAICAEWNPHPMRTVGGMILFPILAGLGGEWCVQQAAGWPKRLRWWTGLAGSALVMVNIIHFAHAYYGEFRFIARAGYRTGLVEAMQYVAAHAHEADFVLVTNYVNQPYIYALLYQPITPQQLAVLPKVTAQGLWGFHQVLRIGKYYFAPKDFPEAVYLFQGEWRRLPPTAQGLVIDVAQANPTPGEVLRRIPFCDSRFPGLDLVIRRWRIGDGTAADQDAWTPAGERER